MGWASGSEIVQDLIVAAKACIRNPKERVVFYKRLIETFERHDWDTQDECLEMDPSFDKALYLIHPDWEV